MLQLDLGYNPISKIEVVSLINLHNLGRGTLYYNVGDHTKKYNPKIYLGAQTSVASTWNTEYGFTLSSWPESMVKNITLLFAHKN